MPRAKQPARKGSSSKGPKKVATKNKVEKASNDEDVATLPSQNDEEPEESSASPRKATARKSKHVTEESKGEQMQIDDVEAEEPAQAASQPEYVSLGPLSVDPPSSPSAPVPTPISTHSRSLAQSVAPEVISPPAGEIDKLTKSACTYAWPIYKQPLARAVLNPHAEREKALRRKLAAGRGPAGEDPNPPGRKKYWLEMPRGYLAVGGCEKVPVWTGDDLNAAVFKWYNHRMEMEAKEAEGPAVNGKEKVKKSAKELREVERARQVDEDTLKDGRNYVSNDAVLQTRAEFLGPDPKVAGFRVDLENVVRIRWWDAFLEQRWSGTSDSWFCEAYQVNDQWKELKDVD